MGQGFVGHSICPVKSSWALCMTWRVVAKFWVSKYTVGIDLPHPLTWWKMLRRMCNSDPVYHRKVIALEGALFWSLSKNIYFLNLLASRICGNSPKAGIKFAFT